jgi:RNA polymerase sigma factor (sigma-70 family)
MSDASVSTWIGQLRQGDDTAAQRLFERYVEQLVRVATDRLRDRPKRRADEEDLVLTVFEEFVSRARMGKFPKLHDRQDLWQILLLITDRRAIDQLRREAAYRKRVRGESTLATPDESTSIASPIEHIADREPTPDEAVAFADELATLLSQLKDDELRAIVGDRLAGLTDNEIAQKRRCSLRTVERRLSEIRGRWSEVAPQGQIEAP